MRKTFVVHIFLADMLAPDEAHIPLPGRLALQVFDVIERASAGTSGSPSTNATAAPVWLRQPGLTVVCDSQDELVEVIRRELEGPAWLM
jgi:hypothetical protein